MVESKKLKAGVIRNDRQMAEGLTIRYYDTAGQAIWRSFLMTPAFSFLLSPIVSLLYLCE